MKGKNGNNMVESRDLETRGIRRGCKRGRCPLCLGEEDAKHILLKCPETKKWREELVCSKWVDINEDIACRKIISCTNVTKIKTTAKYLFKTKCKWETKFTGGKPAPLPHRLAGS
jgi:hypothetical protein